jgi:phosphonopyruvate decarboxylase
MIDCRDFCESLDRQGISFFAGVPDSLLKSFCAYLTENIPQDQHIVTPNEGNAVALATG